jgi:hypothetical protein
MIPVDQTVTDPVLGNCLSACVASILELPIEEVPWFNEDPATWWERFGAWCEARGHTPIFLPWSTPAPVGYAIAGVASRRADGVLHAIVCLDGKIVHDPQPRNRGDGVAPYREEEIVDWIILQPHAEPLHDLARMAGWSEVSP